MINTNYTTRTTATIQPLLEYFNRLIHLNNGEIDLVSAKFHPHLFLKKQFALQHGKGAVTIYLSEGIYGLDATVTLHPVNWHFSNAS